VRFGAHVGIMVRRKKKEELEKSKRQSHLIPSLIAVEYGGMIQCDQCKVWQHMECVKVHDSSKDYFCEKCRRALELKYVDPCRTQHPNTWHKKDVFVMYLKTRGDVPVDSKVYHQLQKEHKRARDFRNRGTNQPEDYHQGNESSDDGEKERRYTRDATRSAGTPGGKKRKSLKEDSDEDDEDYNDDDDVPVKPSPKAMKRLENNRGRYGEGTAPQAAIPLSIPAQRNPQMVLVAYPHTKEEKNALPAGINKDQFPCKKSPHSHFY